MKRHGWFFLLFLLTVVFPGISFHCIFAADEKVPTGGMVREIEFVVQRSPDEKTDPGKPDTVTEENDKAENDKKDKRVHIKSVLRPEPILDKETKDLYQQLGSPRRVFVFLKKAVMQNDFLKGAKAFDFSKHPQLTDAEKKDLVFKFDFILSRISTMDIESIPDDATKEKSTIQPNMNYPPIELVKTSDHYLFSSDIIDQIQALYDQVRELPPAAAEQDVWVFMSQDWFKIKWGLSYIQWLGLFLIVVVGWLLGLLASRALYYLTLAPFQILRRDASTYKISRRMWQPMGWLVTYCFWYIGIVAMRVPPSVSEVVGYPLRTLAIIMCVLTALRLTNFAGELIRTKVQEKFSKIDQILVPLFKRTMKILIICSGIITFFQMMGFSAVGILSGMGIGGIAIALAAQNTIANFFGSVTVLMDRPFMIGDWIVTSGIEGEVESVGLRSTRIRTFYNSQITIPNNLLTTAIIDNMGRRNFRRYKTLLSLHYDTPPERIEAFCEGVRELILSYSNTRKDKLTVETNELGASSIDVLLNCFFLVPDYAAEARARAVLILDILKLAKKLNVEFAYPTQTIYTAPRLDESLTDAEATEELARNIADEIIELEREKEKEKKMAVTKS